MISTWLFYWLSNDQGMMSLLTQNWVSGILLIALIIFLETGMVVLPFLPGDSLLFTAGAFLGLAGISPVIPLLMLATAAIVGDCTNYAIGRSRIGHYFLHRKWVKPEYIKKTHQFFEEYGGQTIVICRFVPVIRTVAPFVAGMSEMSLKRFLLFNALGGVLWTSLFLLAGVWLGRIVWVKEHFSLLVAMTAVGSLFPILWHVVAIYRRKR